MISNRAHTVINLYKSKKLANQNKPHSPGPCDVCKRATRVSVLDSIKQWVSLAAMFILVVVAMNAAITIVRNLWQ